MSRDSFESRAEKKKEELKRRIEAQDHDHAEDLGKKFLLIDDLVRAERKANKLQKPTVFISFAGDYGEEMHKTVVLPAVRELKTEMGMRFKTENGMKSHGRPDVIEHIATLMEPCCIFLGILTKEFELKIDDPREQWTPGGWVLLEAGMALSMKIPVVFFREEGIHKNFWFDFLGNSRHATFNRENPAPGLKLAQRLILEHYQKLRALAR